MSQKQTPLYPNNYEEYKFKFAFAIYVLQNWPLRISTKNNTLPKRNCKARIKKRLYASVLLRATKYVMSAVPSCKHLADLHVSTCWFEPPKV